MRLNRKNANLTIRHRSNSIRLKSVASDLFSKGSFPIYIHIYRPVVGPTPPKREVFRSDSRIWIFWFFFLQGEVVILAAEPICGEVFCDQSSQAQLLGSGNFPRSRRLNGRSGVACFFFSSANFWKFPDGSFFFGLSLMPRCEKSHLQMGPHFSMEDVNVFFVERQMVKILR